MLFDQGLNYIQSSDTMCRIELEWPTERSEIANTEVPQASQGTRVVEVGRMGRGPAGVHLISKATAA